MSHQTCHCGWSKVTTYQGLRIHQGKKGCTPKGVSIPQSQYLKARQDCYDICTPVKDGREDLNAHFQSPHHYVERATERSSETAQRALHFDNYDLAGQRKIKADLRQKVQMRKQKVEEISASLKKCKGDLDREVSEISGVFDEVIRVVMEARREALQPVKKRIHRVEREANDLTQGLQRAIYQLETQAHRPPGEEVDRDWTKVAVDTTTSFGTMRSIMAAMMERIKLELEKLTSIEIQRVPKFAVDVKLDPNTAHARLVLFDKKTQVRDGGESEEVVEAPEGFDVFASVLGMDNINPDKSYWEVDVGDKTGWDLGIARGDANRKGQLLLNPDNGYWVTVHYDDEHYAAMTLPPTRLALKEKPQKVGMFVDRDEGLVSFYDVTAGSHIYSFTGCSFGGELYPYLSPHLRQGDNNAEPLAISPVKLDEDEDL